MTAGLEASVCLHATTIAVGGRAAIIRGPSGSGKSDLALRCLTQAPSTLVPQPAILVADDQTLVKRDGQTLAVSSPQALQGLLEVRSVGLIRVDFTSPAIAVLCIDLIEDGPIERYPDPWPTTELLGLSVPLLRLRAFEPTAHLKVLLTLKMASLPPVREGR